MTDYEQLVNALRWCAKPIPCSKTECPRKNMDEDCACHVLQDAAAAIEALLKENKELIEDHPEMVEADGHWEWRKPNGEVLMPKRGEWIDGDARRVTARCSVCGHLRLGNGAEWANKHVHFCEVCGSKMGDEKA